MIELSTIIYILVLIILVSMVIGSIVNWFLEGDLFEDAFNDEHSNTDEAGKH
jgi:membrane protein YqaA with SNARE-associated domain